MFCKLEIDESEYLYMTPVPKPVGWYFWWNYVESGLVHRHAVGPEELSSLFLVGFSTHTDPVFASIFGQTV